MIHLDPNLKVAQSDASNVWLSYALDAIGLLVKSALIVSEDITIKSIAPSDEASGAFDRVVSIADVEIQTSARLAEVLGVVARWS